MLGVVNVDVLGIISLATNVSHIPEGGDYEAQNYQLTQMFNRSTNVHISTKPPVLGICCYVPFFFTNLN
jgi:hypothetical protein